MRVETISVRCPACGRPTANDIVVHAGVQVYGHHGPKGCGRRFVVAPDPDGDDHLAQLVPNTEASVDFLEAVLDADPDLKRRHRRLLSLGAANAA